MANEATIRSSLRIKVGNIDYQSNPTSFRCDVAGEKGPTPGAITVSVQHTNVDLSQLVKPGLCRIMNIHDTVIFDVGIYDASSNKFHPFMKLLPGESYIIRLSEFLSEDLDPGTGTGTADIFVNSLAIKSRGAAGTALVEAFES